MQEKVQQFHGVFDACINMCDRVSEVLIKRQTMQLLLLNNYSYQEKKPPNSALLNSKTILILSLVCISELNLPRSTKGVGGGGYIPSINSWTVQ